MKKSVLFISLVSLLLFSCENSLRLKGSANESQIETQSSTVTSSPDEKAYITLGTVQLADNSRTINPVYSADVLTSLTLYGRSTASQPTPGNSTDYNTIKSGANVAAFQENLKSAEIKPGLWDFYLKATYLGFEYNSYITVDIKAGETHALNFILEPKTFSYPYGYLDLTVKFWGNADSVVATLKESSSTSTVKLEKTFTASNTNNPISSVDGQEYKQINFKTTSSNNERVVTGKYYVSFKFYVNGIDDPINTVEHIVRIQNYVTTKATLDVRLTDVYPITYNYWEGTAGFTEDELAQMTVAGNVQLPTYYSKKTQFTLPQLSLPGYTFKGWYKDSACNEEDKITQINSELTGPLTLNAQFEAGSSGPSLDGFTVFEAGSVSTSGVYGNPENQHSGDVFNIPALAVCDHLITQTEYEQFMTYYGKVWNGDYPSDSDNKNTTPAYYVSWVEAIVYCNLRSLAENLTPVYTMDDEYDITEDGNAWTQYYHIVKDTNSQKYFYDYNEENTAWDLGEKINTDFTADGYRLPATWEYAYIIQKNSSFIDSNGINEWSHTYYTDGSRVFFVPSTKAADSGKPTYYRESNLGFRVVRNVQ